MNVALTGIPRSGTTLTCYLLNKLPDTVALLEPMKVAEFYGMANHDLVVDHIERFFESTRDSILNRHVCVTKHFEGAIPDNPVASEPESDGRRKDITEKGIISIEKDLTSDFFLSVKHPSAFSAILKTLARRFRCYAQIRNPLSVLASWNSVRMNFAEGHAPAAERLDTGLAAALGGLENKYDRQLCLLSWFFDQYSATLPPESIIRYEDIVASGGRCLEIMNPAAKLLDEPLVSKNMNRFYDSTLMTDLSRKLLRSEGGYWRFYSKRNVEEIADGCESPV